MKQLFIGLVIGLTCSACCFSYNYIKSTPMKVVMTDRNFVNTTIITTEEGTYRLFTIESTDGKGGVGISAVKIKWFLYKCPFLTKT